MRRGERCLLLSWRPTSSPSDYPKRRRASGELLSSPETGRCVLALYRSAAQPKMAEYGEELARAERRPALVIIATEDPYVGGEVLARRTAKRCGAEVAVLEGLGHWWMLEDPGRGAATLSQFHDSVE